MNRINKVKHIVVTIFPGFTNGRYWTSMSSSNLVNVFFGSLSIDLSYSDTTTPVDINGVDADENYMKEIANAQLNEWDIILYSFKNKYNNIL